MATRRDMISAKQALVDVDYHRIEKVAEDLVLCSCKHWSTTLDEHYRHVQDTLSEKWLTRPARRANFTDEERQDMADTWNNAAPGFRTRAVSQRFGIAPRSVTMYLTRLEKAGYEIDHAGRDSGGKGQE